MTTLADYGWNEKWENSKKLCTHSNLPAARIIADYGRKYKIALPEVKEARLAGQLTHHLASTDMPKVGDWVAIELSGDDYIIRAVLPRQNELVRGNASKQLTKQVVATNVDVAFVVQPLDQHFSLERIERYVFQLSNQSIRPVVLLNKADMATNAHEIQHAVEKLGVDSYVMSALHDTDVKYVQNSISPGTTTVILGSSGAGKSTLTNRLFGSDIQATAELRERDQKGRHTTVHRELFILPSGGMIIDTPGIRELQLWGDLADLDESFADVARVMRQCRYRNCSHTTENGCALQASLASGTLERRRYDAYVNFKQELQALEDKRGFIAERRNAHSKATAKRRRARTLHRERDQDLF